MNSVNSLPKHSRASILYRLLLKNFNLKHWQIRTIMLSRLGFNQEQIQAVMKRNRRRVREANESLIFNIVEQLSPMQYDEQVKTLRRLQHLDSIEWAVMSDIIRRLNVLDPENRRRRWSKFNSLRQREVKEALALYDERMIGAWLLIDGHAKPISLESQFFRQEAGES